MKTSEIMCYLRMYHARIESQIKKIKRHISDIENDINASDIDDIKNAVISAESLDSLYSDAALIGEHVKELNAKINEYKGK